MRFKEIISNSKTVEPIRKFNSDTRKDDVTGLILDDGKKYYFPVDGEYRQPAELWTKKATDAKLVALRHKIGALDVDSPERDAPFLKLPIVLTTSGW